MGEINIHILKASSRLILLESSIRQISEEAIKKITEKIELPPVDIVIIDNPEKAIPETGIGGYTYTPHFLLVSIDPNFPSLSDHLPKELTGTLAHELNHCARMKSLGEHAKRTLLEAIISEGLADHFDMEITGSDPRPWDVALDKDAMKDVWKKAEGEFESSEYNQTDWFFGSKEKNIPRWAGYTLGFWLVNNYLNKTGKRASEMTNAPAADFVKQSTLSL